MNDAKFVDGLRAYAPHENAPDFIIANLVVEDVGELIGWLQRRIGTKPRIDIKRAKSGKLYASENDYQGSKPERQESAKAPQAEQGGGFEDDQDLPF